MARLIPVEMSCDAVGSRGFGYVAVLVSAYGSAVGFDFEPEVTAKLLRARRRIMEVPSGSHPRRADEGKKIRWIDGVDALYVLIKTRLTRF